MGWYTDTSTILPYIQYFLNDNNNNFSNDLVNRLVQQAGVELGNELGHCIFRYSFDVTANQPTYQLDLATKDVLRVTVNGFKMEPKTQSQMAMLSPVYRSFGSRPFYYSIQMDGYLVIRFFPIPTLSQSAVPTNLISADNGIINGFVVTATQNIPEVLGEIALPSYVGRKVIKDFVLWKAFANDGPGQDLRSAKYFKSKYQGRIQVYKDVINAIVLPTTRELEDVMVQKPYRLAPPILPPNFGPIVGY